MRVLLADPDTEFLEIVQCFLGDRGHEAEIAADGPECISLLQDFVPDVVVMDTDLRWGDTDGVLAEMREDPLLSNLPVILTSNGMDRDEVVAVSRLPTAHLFKPYRLGELLVYINSANRVATTR
jgi:CheY-like chemotaxis protein